MYSNPTNICRPNSVQPGWQFHAVFSTSLVDILGSKKRLCLQADFDRVHCDIQWPSLKVRPSHSLYIYIYTRLYIYIYIYIIYIYIYHICIYNFMISYIHMNHSVCSPQNFCLSAQSFAWSFLGFWPPRCPRWCAGVMLFELLSGDPPFASRSSRELERISIWN